MALIFFDTGYLADSRSNRL